ncbi:MAG: hypothetical protein ABI611_13655 [Solirubrobacteraceae bacterium]
MLEHQPGLLSGVAGAARDYAIRVKGCSDQMDLLGKETPAGLHKLRQFVGVTHRIFLGSVASATAHPPAPLVRFDRSCGGFQPRVREQAA